LRALRFVTKIDKLNRMRTRFYLHLALWCVLLAIFLTLSVPSVVRAVWENKIGPINPNHSTDSYLEGLTRVRNGTELFTGLVQTVPRDKAIAIFVDSESSPSKFLGMVVAYLAWPHEIKTIAVTPATYAREVTSVHHEAIGAAIFCAMKPPLWIKNKTDFGTKITFVPVAALNPNP
jgi:hypothetical protein